MTKYIIKRLLLALLILFGVSIILYALVRVMPADYIADEYYKTHQNVDVDSGELKQLMLDNNLESLEDVWAQGYSDLWNKVFRNGEPALDADGNIKTTAPFFAATKSIVAGYCNWLGNFVTGNFGTSFKYNRPVTDVILQYMGYSFTISLISLVLQLLISIPLGIKSACNQYGKLDYITTVLTMIGISFPSFFFGSIVIKIFAVDLGWFPAGGIGSSDPLDQLWHMVLPILVLTILSVGSMMRYTRTNTLEVLNADYIRTARAKGLSESTVVYKHVFRNTLIPLVTTLAGIIPSLFGGAMITETVFDLPGIGNIAYQCMLVGDVPFIMAYNMFLAVLTVIGILLTDLMYAVVDPRVKLGK